MEFRVAGRSKAKVERQDVDELRQWLSTRTNLPHQFPDDLLESFLHSNYLNIEKTKRAIEVYWNCKEKSPEFFKNRSLDTDGMKHILDVVEMCLLAGRTEKGYAVLVARLKDPDASHFVLEDAVKLLFMTVDVLLRSDPTPRGVVFLFDNAHVRFKHLTRLSLSTIRKYFIYIQEAMPVRMKAIHVLNINSVIAHVMTLIKPFMHKEHADQIILHKEDCMEDVYECIPQDMLPQDYGGKQPPMSMLTAKTLSDIRNEAEWFKKEESYSPEEETKEKNQDAGMMHGFFKKLGFD